MSVRILQGDCRTLLKAMPSECVHCVVTSPPYWGLRDYKIEPQVWDGDPACAHEWGTIERTPWANSVKGPTNPGKHGTDYAIGTKEHGAWCQVCGAWRGCLGLEPDYRMFVVHIVEVFREVRRVLRPDGTLWLNMGDSYATGAGKVGTEPGGGARGAKWSGKGYREAMGKHLYASGGIGPMTQPNRMEQFGLKAKDMCGMPWRVAFALQDDGWWLRQDIIWHKPNPMPESITDRCTKAHEYLFLLAKNERYYFDAEAIAEDCNVQKYKMPDGWDTGEGAHGSFHRNGREKGAPAIRKSDSTNDSQVPGAAPHTGLHRAGTSRVGRPSGNKTHKLVSEYEQSDSEEHRTKAGLLLISETAYPTRNKRSVWTVATAPFKEAHFATFPPDLIEPCILAGCPKGGIVLDPFGGAGTTGLVADRLQRDALLIEINPQYVEMARSRLSNDAPLFTEVK